MALKPEEPMWRMLSGRERAGKEERVLGSWTLARQVAEKVSKP
jgi:hypothetical protein